jgi:RNA polymerase sigma-70 factor (ECF subfamily)
MQLLTRLNELVVASHRPTKTDLGRQQNRGNFNQHRHILLVEPSLYVMAKKLHDMLNTQLSPEPLSSEEQLVARALAGDETAFGELYERYLADIYQYIYYRVNCRREAEDLSEGVFLRAWKALDENPPREVTFRLWLYRIAHNAVVDHYRARKELVGLEVAADIPDPVAGPEEAVAGRENIAELRRAMQLLSEDQQEVLICRFITGLSHTETATVMARSEQAVRALQYRAIVGLRNLLNYRMSKNGLSKNGLPKNGQARNELSNNGRSKNGLFIKKVDSYV